MHMTLPVLEMPRIFQEMKGSRKELYIFIAFALRVRFKPLNAHGTVHYLYTQKRALQLLRMTETSHFCASLSCIPSNYNCEQCLHHGQDKSIKRMQVEIKQNLSN